MPFSRKKTPLAGLFCLAAFVAGCGSVKPTGQVSGNVTYKGKSIESGEVTFHAKARGFAANTNLEGGGKFTFLQPMEVGDYEVYVTPPRPEPTDPRKGPPPVVKSNIPQKARDIATSGLTATVKEGLNDIPVELKD